MDDQRIHGIYTPTIVFTRADGRLAEDELRRHVSWLIDSGIDGLYPNGSTGEAVRLSPEDRRRVVEIVADETAGRVPVMAGAAEPNVELMLEACSRYAELGCRAASVTGPAYYRVGPEAVEHYFRVLASRSPIDILLYNIPQFTSEIGLESVRRLAADCPRIVGIKDSSRDMPRFVETLALVKPERPEFACLVGCEEMLLPALLMGADGGTIATSGLVPEAFARLYDGFRAVDVAEPLRIQFALLPLIRALHGAGGFPEGFRTGVGLRGFETGRGPQPVDPAAVARLPAGRPELSRLVESVLTDLG